METSVKAVFKAFALFLFCGFACIIRKFVGQLAKAT